MDSTTLVSVVIPTHNRPDFLRKTLESIIGQTYFNLEIIVVSNGFNAKNREVVESLKDPRLIYLEQANSGSPSSPRNHGIRVANGEYVAFCDDDDLWLPEKIQLQVTGLNSNNEHGLCYSKMLRFDDSREWANKNEEGPASLSSLLYVNTIPISSVIIRKYLLDELGGFSESPVVGTSEDYEFLLRYSVVTHFLFLDEYLIRYWTGNNRTTAVDSERTVKKCLDYLKSICGCYMLLYKTHELRLSIFIKPLIYNLNLFFKTLAFIFLKKAHLR
jgi:glycosyltransferase involved in cell wall biosynthesis